MKFASGSETSGLKQMRKQRFDFAPMNGFHDLHGADTRPAEFRQAQCPRPSPHAPALPGSVMDALARQLIAFLAVLAAALAIALPGDHDAARSLRGRCCRWPAR